ncbi:MAG: motility protein A [Anaerolineales bacterium]|nr:motility protein A [Anaerolineales bacterium]
MDLGTLFGLLLSLVVITIVMIMDGGSPAELFLHPQAILLTLGGSFLATAISTPLSVALALPKLIGLAFKGDKTEPAAAIETLVKMADRARRDGLLALEDESKKISDPFLRKGLMLVVDGVDPAQVRAIIETEIHNMEKRHAQGIGMFSAAGGFAPTFGIIGTVMGLITVLQQLDEPSKLGKAIAGAFLATLWGLLSANLIWLPLGSKLRNKSEHEVVYREMLLEGILALQAGENPRLVKEKLSAFLAPKARAGEPVSGSPAKAGTKA